MNFRLFYQIVKPVNLSYFCRNINNSTKIIPYLDQKNIIISDNSDNSGNSNKMLSIIKKPCKYSIHYDTVCCCYNPSTSPFYIYPCDKNNGLDINDIVMNDYIKAELSARTHAISKILRKIDDKLYNINFVLKNLSNEPYIVILTNIDKPINITINNKIFTFSIEWFMENNFFQEEVKKATKIIIPNAFLIFSLNRYTGIYKIYVNNIKRCN
jgi:hypothetical protein